jgi:hypothetical protein
MAFEKITISQLVKKFAAFYGAFRVHKSPPLHPILKHLNTVHTLTPYIFKIRFNTVFKLQAQLATVAMKIGR